MQQACLHLSFAKLVEDMARRVERRDEHFARLLAAALHTKASYITFPEVEGLDLQEVVVTLSMDKAAKLVITGYLPESHGQVMLEWQERDFERVQVLIHEAARVTPYLFATLDYGVRDRTATLIHDAPPFKAGQRVRVRALATLGLDAHYRVSAEGREASIKPEALNLEGS